MSQVQSKIAYIGSILTGVGIWVGVMLLTGEHEAWDSESYFIYAWPFMAFISGVLGFLVPDRPWRWGAIIIASQAVAALILSRSANLLPFGIAIFLVLSVPCILTAYGGAVLRRRIELRS